MSEEPLPPDVFAVLSQLLEEAREAVAAGEYDTARSAVDSAATVTENKVPAGPRRERLTHCCRAVADLLADPDGESDAAAREYLRAMDDRLDGEGA